MPKYPIQSNSSMHHYECVALCKDTSLQRGRFCARSLASCIQRSSEDRSSWMFFIQVVCCCPGGRLQFSGGGSKTAWLASARPRMTYKKCLFLWRDSRDQLMHSSLHKVHIPNGIWIGSAVFADLTAVTNRQTDRDHTTSVTTRHIYDPC